MNSDEILPAYLVKGDDASLVADCAQDILSRVADGRELSMVLEEHGGGGEDIDVGAVVDALATPPFISDRRVVAVRDAGRLLAADAERLVQCLDSSLPGVVLVVVSGSGTVPAALVKAIGAFGGVVDSAVGRGRARTQWLDDQLSDGPVKLDARARAVLSDHLGGDVARLRGLVGALAAAYGQGASIDPERLAPFLGEAGAVAPWDLTDAIDSGDTPASLDALARLLGAGGLHPLAALAVLHRHFEAMLRLDGADVTSPDDAAALLGMRSSYPARKAMEQGRRLGSARIGRAITLLAAADLDVRGRSGLPDSLVLEVLVARLSRLGAVRDPAGRRPPHRQAAARRR